MRNLKVLLLDEATSALETESEKVSKILDILISMIVVSFLFRSFKRLWIVREKVVRAS